jgi:hypothetical protein
MRLLKEEIDDQVEMHCWNKLIVFMGRPVIQNYNDMVNYSFCNEATAAIIRQLRKDEDLDEYK